MSQKKDEIVTDDASECRVDTIAVTRTTMKAHRIRWTIQNVSKLPLDTKIIGPDFNLTKIFLCNISFEKSSGCLFVYLNNKSDSEIKIQRNLVLFDSDGRGLHQEKMGQVFTLEKSKDVDIIGNVQRSQFDSLKDDILIINCLLNVEGCITTVKRFSKSERDSRKDLVQDLKALFNDPIDSDFTLRVGDEIILTHKALLRARSAYFKKMFETKMKESTENFVSITDVAYPIMQKLVEFLYTGDFTETLEDNNIQQISEIYFAADKYEVIELRDLCAEKLISMATADSICQILLLAHHHSDEDLKIRTLEFISYHFDVVEKSNAWKTFISSEFALVSEVLSFCFKKVNF